jgi:hypothetical protein
MKIYESKLTPNKIGRIDHFRILTIHIEHKIIQIISLGVLYNLTTELKNALYNLSLNEFVLLIVMVFLDITLKEIKENTNIINTKEL